MQSISWQQYPRAIPACLGRRSLLSVFITIASLVGVASAEAQYACLPSCADSDGKMFVVPGGGTTTSTFTRPEMVLKVDVPAAVPQLEVGIFDGDSGATDLGGAAHWDQGTVPMTYEIYTDPEGDGIGNALIRTDSGAGMPDNAWFTILQGHDAGALSSGVYRYVLRIVNSNPAPFTWSAFKVRTPDTNTIRLGPQIFSIIAPLGGLPDAQVLYPSYPALAPTTYDGNWEFFFEVQPGQKFVTLWDGDTDYGTSDCSTVDTDDPDTPNAVPAFAAGTTAAAEGVATTSLPACPSTQLPTGNPPDDDLSGSGTVYVRSGSVVIRLVDPNGTQYTNLNPAGNKEWEQFTISSELGCSPASADVCVPTIVPGTWRMQVLAMDAGNVNSFFIPLDTVTPQRRVRVQKMTDTGTHPAQTFQGTIAPGGPSTAWSLNLGQDAAASAQQDLTVGTAAQTVTETSVPIDWTLVGYTVKPDPNGTATCDVNESYQAGPASIPGDTNNYLVCIRNDYQLPNRTVRIQKVTGTAQHPAQTFAGGIAPGGPSDTTWSVDLPLDGSPSTVATLLVATSLQTVTETIPPSWVLLGFTVKLDPTGTATCDVNEPYAGVSATVPADGDNYLVCVRNDQGGNTRMVRIQKVTDTPTHPAQVFAGLIVPGGPNTGAWAVGLGTDGSHSDVADRQLLTSAQTITESALPPDWTLVGFTVKLDPTGTAVCDLNEAYAGTQALVPGDSNAYLVCVKNAYAEQQRTIRIIKTTLSGYHPSTDQFSGDIQPGTNAGVVPFTVSLPPHPVSVGTATSVLVNTTQQALTETTLPANWGLVGYVVKPDPTGTETCSPLDTYSAGPAVIPAGIDAYLVCIRNDYTLRQIRVGKVTATAGHPQETFGGTIAPASQPWSVLFAANEVISAAVSTHIVSTLAQTVTENLPPPEWSVRGFVVKPDPSGTETCSLNDPYTGSSAQIPADGNNYLVCVCNDYSLPPGTRTVRVQKVIGAPGGDHPGATVDVIAQPGPGALLTVIPPDNTGPFPSVTPVGQLILSTFEHSLTEVPLPSPWLKLGYAVIPDPTGTAVCTGNETYSGTSAHIPADYTNYLVCIRNDYGRRLRLQKVTASPTHPGIAVQFDIVPGLLGPVVTGDSLAVDTPLGAGSTVLISGAAQNVAEILPLPSSWALVGYTVKPDPTGTAVCDPNEAYGGVSALVPSGTTPYLVCVRNDYGRFLRFQKVTGTLTHPGGAFPVFVTPGFAAGPSIDVAPLGLGPDDPASPISGLLGSLSALAVVETLPGTPAGWSHVGIAVKPDPNQTAVCDINTDTFVPQPASVPAGPGNYLICIRNEWTQPPPATRAVYIGKVTLTPFHPAQPFAGTVVSNAPAAPPVPYGMGLLLDQAVGAQTSVVVPSNYTATVVETPPPFWVLVGFTLQVYTGSEVCDPQAPYSGASVMIPADTQDYLVCVRDDYVPVTRQLRVEKVAPVTHPGGVFSVHVSPGGVGPAVWTATLPPNTAGGPFLPGGLVSTAPQIVHEFSLSAGWGLVGYAVKPDNPAGSATCNPLDTYLPGPAIIPPETSNYLVCVKNEYGRPLRVQKVTGTATHPAANFSIRTFSTPDGSAQYDDPVTLAQDAASDVPVEHLVGFTSVSVVETTTPAPWGVAGYLVKPDPNGTETCSATESGYGPSGLVPDGAGRYLVCVRNEYSRRLRIQKVVGLPSAQDQTFDVTVIAGHPDLGVNPTIQFLVPANAGSAPAQQVLLDFTAQTVFETLPPAPWVKIGYTIKPDPDGAAICDLNETYTGGHVHVPAGFEWYLVCIRNDFDPPPPGHVTRTVRVQKVTDAPAHPGAAFGGTVTPGGPNTNAFALTLDPNAQASSAVPLTLTSTTQQLVETTLTQYWSVVGYVVVPDPNGTAVCDLNATYVGAQAYVPGDGLPYLVCIKNAFNPPPRTIRIRKMTLTPNHPQQVFDGTIVPGVPDTAFQVTLGAIAIISPSVSYQAASLQPHVVTETPLPALWQLDGYQVYPDPTGTAFCLLGGPLLPTATIPADASNYLVCIQNTYTGVPAMNVSKNSTTTSVTTAGVVPYTYTVSNTGNVTLTNVTLADSNTDAPPVCVPAQPATLVPLAFMSCTAQHTVTQGEIDANGSPTPGSGFLSNTATADSDQTTPQQVTLNIPIVQTLALVLTKTGVLNDTVVAPSGTANPGDQITYSFSVLNAGNVTVTGITVVDPSLPTLSCTVGTLAPGLGSGCVATGNVYTLTQADIDAGQVVNTATAAGTAPGPTPVSDPDQETVLIGQTAAIGLTKTHALTTDADSSGDVSAGDTLTYTFAVTNTGNVTLTGVTIADPLPGLSVLSCTPTQPATLAPAGTLVCTATYVVTPADVTAGVINNTATADSDQTGAVTASDTVTVLVADLSVTKTDGSATYTAGATTTYTIVVSNLGPSDVIGATVTDTMPSGLTSFTWTCAAGAGASCSASGSGTISDTVNIPAGSSVTYTVVATTSPTRTGNLDNTATVTAPGGVTDNTPGNNTATDTDINDLLLGANGDGGGDHGHAAGGAGADGQLHV